VSISLHLFHICPHIIRGNSRNAVHIRLYLSVRPSARLSIYLSIYGSTSFCWALVAFSVGLLGWGISSLQGRYLHTGQHKHRINAYRHLCLKWDLNQRSQCLSGRRQFIPQTSWPLWSANIRLTCGNYDVHHNTDEKELDQLYSKSILASFKEVFYFASAFLPASCPIWTTFLNRESEQQILLWNYQK
jgi:hypothetical protein